MRSLLPIFAALFLTAAHAGEFFFRDGDVPILFLGDSITEQRRYTTYLEAYVTTRFPQWKVQFRNLGWGGDTAGLSRRESFENGLKRDILPHNAKAITIDFGMNDARSGEAGFPKYVDHTTKLVQRLKAAGTRVALVTPSPEERYEPDHPGGSNYNHMLAKYSNALKEIAQKEEVVFVDQFNPFIQVIAAGRKAGILGAGGEPRLIPDAVHPNWAGHLVMAHAILKGLNAPALVSSASLDAAAKKVENADGCEVEFVDAAGAEIAFKRTDKALPLHIPEEARFALNIPGFMPLDDLSRYELKITNLKADNYDLLIDDKKAGTFSKVGLEGGINLSLSAGPISEQATAVFQRIIEKNHLYFFRWRQVQIFDLPAWAAGPESEAKRQAELAKYDKQIADKEAEIEKLRKPAPHVFKLVPTK